MTTTPSWPVCRLIQNAAARLVFNIPKFTHIILLLRSLHWLPAAARIRFKTLVFKTLAFPCTQLYTFVFVHNLKLTNNFRIQRTILTDKEEILHKHDRLVWPTCRCTSIEMGLPGNNFTYTDQCQANRTAQDDCKQAQVMTYMSDNNIAKSSSVLHPSLPSPSSPSAVALPWCPHWEWLVSCLLLLADSCKLRFQLLLYDVCRKVGCNIPVRYTELHSAAPGLQGALWQWHTHKFVCPQNEFEAVTLKLPCFNKVKKPILSTCGWGSVPEGSSTPSSCEGGEIGSRGGVTFAYL